MPLHCGTQLPTRTTRTLLPHVPRRWWWRSVMCGGSTALFIYGYCFYYYHARSDMSGFMQVGQPCMLTSKEPCGGGLGPVWL